ncbi:MAG: hypothetical protein GOMPHAMPRED_003738 [Gomphillus americanus]|uniref:AAA+ ATPase domain-containing protein n=1 Tax=Gomphillus americanus TaxID=1940652 RepID=A0A8H3FK15_9LECA|nr:MAG: hypothetical protein GOMPHAMPRED_003738 [Gomphillus americanus]
MARDSRYGQIATDIAIMLLGMGLSYWVVQYGLSKIDMDNGAADAKKRKATAAAVMQRIDQRERRVRAENDDFEETIHESNQALLGPRKEDLVLNQYEQTIASEVVAPEDIAVGFEDIGGLENVIEELKEAVIYPLTMPNIYSQSSALLSAPSGVLLYGPPGCGKTMLAKALAKESGANFINLHISTLTEKWFGDSNKLVNAVFSLARKLQPTIVFIDEIDAVLGQRRSGEHEASAMVKAEFMTHWDGLASANVYGKQQRILILGATNRMQDIDEAILRRMPKKFPVSRPNTEQRERILRLLLKDTKIDRQNFDLDFLTKVSNGMSGSDLKEACRDAAMIPVRECIRQKRTKGGRMGPIYPDEIRGLRTDDFFQTAGGSVLQEQLADAISKTVKTKSDKLGQRRISQVEEVDEEFQDLE